jgi:hypothetical protein
VKHSSFIALFLTLSFSVSAPAQDWRFGGNIYRESFFDFSAAKANWQALKSAEQIKAYLSKNCPTGSAYESWAKKFGLDQKSALNDLKTDPNAESIRRCHDIYLTAYKWDELWGYWRAAPSKIRKWNEIDEASATCDMMRRRNIFTGQCNDMPNWREWRVGR